MSTEPDELSAFTAAVSSHLGTEPAERPPGLEPSELLATLTDEALGLVTAGYRIWSTTQAAKAAAHRLTPRREPMRYHGAGKQKLVLIRDTREQWEPEWPEGVECQTAHLQFADYSVAGLTDSVAIEMKWSLDDYATCITSDRERFTTMLQGLSRYPVRGLIVAASEADVWAHRYTSKVSPRSLMASTWSFAQDFGVMTVFAGDRRGATEALLWWAYRARAKATKAAKQKAVA